MSDWVERKAKPAAAGNAALSVMSLLPATHHAGRKDRKKIHSKAGTSAVLRYFPTIALP
jgi:hypothetical protein